MLSSHVDFPKDEFLNTLRKNLEEAETYIKQATKHNIEWIYQSIKHIHNVLIESKQNPNTKLNSLKMIKALIQTCEIPCLNLIEVYILPIIFSVSAYKPQQTGERRGFRFFIDSGYSPRILNIQQTGIQFIRLSTQILYVCSVIRTKRTLECEQLNQQSQFIQFFNKLKSLGITEISSNKKLKFFKEDFPEKARNKYLKKLANFQKISENYTEYFVIRMVESLQIQQNPLFSNAGKTVSSLSTDLDFKKLLKYGDTFITSPLIQQLIDGVQTSENFSIKKNFLSLLSDFVKWADIQAFIQISYEDAINQIGLRISEVQGQKSLDAGENIYPQIKGQKDAKKKFYIQFLKSIEVWTICMKNALGNQEPSIAEQLYIFFKVQKKFKFPQNLLLKKIEEDFRKNEQKNRQKNSKVFERLKLDETSAINTKKSINRKSINQKSLKIQVKESEMKKISFDAIKKNLEECYEDFDTLFDDQKLINKKMKKMIRFKENFEGDLQNIDTEPDQDELLAVLDDGDALIDHITAIEPFYKDYKQKKISLQQFGDLISEYLQGIDDQQQFENSQSQTHSQSISNNKSKSMSNNNNSKTSRTSHSRKLVMNKQMKQVLNPTITEEKVVTQNSKIKKPSIELATIHIQKIQEPKSSIPSIKDEQDKSVKKVFNRSKISQKNSHLDHLKEKSKISRISNNFSNTQLLKQKVSQKVNDASGYQNVEESPLKQYKNHHEDQSQNHNQSQNFNLDESKFTVKSKIKTLISAHRSNRTNKSQNFEALRNSVTQNDFSRDIKNIVYKDLIVKKKVGAQEEGLNIIEKVNKMINGQNPSMISASQMSKKKSLLKSVKQKRQSSILSDKRSRISKQSNDDYMMSNKNKAKKLNNVNSQKQFQLFKPQSELKHSSSSVGLSSKLKLKRQISKLSKISKKSRYNQNTMNKNLASKKRNQNTQEHQDHYQMRQVNEQQKVQVDQPQEAYYGIQELQVKVKSDKKNFKDCLQTGKNIRNSYLDEFSKVNEYALFRRENGVNGDYLMMKLKRQQERQKDSDLKGMENRVMKLRSETSRIRRQLSARSKGSLSKRSNSNNTSQNSRQHEFVRSQKSHKFSDTMRSFSKGKSSHTSKQSIKSIEGRAFQSSTYQHYFNEVTTNHVKKTFLKPKTLLHHDENIEIGAICRFEETLKIILFITPSDELHEFRYKITQQLTLGIKSYPEYYPKIPEKKQVKINLSTQLKAMPFTIPQININYIQRGKKKSLSLVLPCPPHRFIQFSNINPGELTATFEHEESRIIRTDEFRVNKSIFKMQKITEYIPNLTLIRKQNALNVYGVEGHFKRESFSLKITTKGSSRMVIQGIPKSRPQFLEYLLSSLRCIISQVQ